jgi:hypothetical protein
MVVVTVTVGVGAVETVPVTPKQLQADAYRSAEEQTAA